jgi:hypothetical protein
MKRFKRCFAFPAAVAALVVLTAACGRRATELDCKHMVDRIAEIQL